MDSPVELSFLCNFGVFAVQVKLDNEAITATNDELVRVDSADCFGSECTDVESEDEHLSLDVEAAHISRGCSRVKVVFSVL